MAVAAPIDEVSHAYAELRQPDRVERDVAHQPVEPAPRLVWLLQVQLMLDGVDIKDIVRVDAFAFSDAHSA